jgi:hypothetical protein
LQAVEIGAARGVIERFSTETDTQVTLREVHALTAERMPE